MTFNGIGATGFIPPDTEGDIGPNHYVEWINTSWAVYNRAGALLLGPAAGNTIFSGLPGTTHPCETTNRGDPLVLYDQLANRWLLSQFGFTSSTAAPFYQCTAVSTTADPTGSYCLYEGRVQDQAGADISTFNDYGKVAMWNDAGGTQNAYFYSFAGFPTAGGFTPAVMAMERAQMLTAGCPTAKLVYFDSTNNAVLAGEPNRMLPSDLDGATLPPAGSPNPYVEHCDDALCGGADRLELFEFHIDWTTIANSTFTKKADIGVPAFDQQFSCDSTANVRQCLPQSGTANLLDKLSSRLMYPAHYRNFGTHQSIVVNQTVDADTDHAAVRWYELRGVHTATPTAFQASTFAPDSRHRWMGSADINALGDIAIGYSHTASDAFPSIRYTGRKATDLADTMQAEAVMQAGAGSQTGSAFMVLNDRARWGDYTHISVDPVDNCSFWYIGEYYTATSSNSWQTAIGRFKVDPTTCLPTAVSVRGFTARWSGSAVGITWRTAAETQTLGFNLYRGVRNAPFRKVNRALIPARWTGRARGGLYRYIDRNVSRTAGYTYRLQLVDQTGKRSWYPIGSATSRA